jgi:hypothetical protein
LNAWPELMNLRQGLTIYPSELAIFLLWPPKYWDTRHAPPHLEFLHHHSLFVLMALGFEFRASHLLGSYSTTWVFPQTSHHHSWSWSYQPYLTT